MAENVRKALMSQQKVQKGLMVRLTSIGFRNKEIGPDHRQEAEYSEERISPESCVLH